MGNLVVCCDGTWQNAVMQAFSRQTNIARIRDRADLTTVKLEPMYVKGVGSGGLKDKILGGAVGKGLDKNLFEAYKFLVANYAVDASGSPDKIFVFGFSRGAYTARSLAGMISRVGLLKSSEMARADDALALYREWKTRAPEGPSFRQLFCHEDVEIQFLGVFDTVGALGVPGLSADKYLFHDVMLGRNVHVARQALAIDEPRMAFEPSLWEDGSNNDAECTGRHGYRTAGSRDVKQVWFKGAHSDIGGGGDRKLSDITLEWMMREAEAAGGGLKFGPTPKVAISNAPGPVKRAMRLLYSAHNAIRRTRFGVLRILGKSVSPRFFGNGHRKLCLRQDFEVAVADPLIADEKYRPPGFERWLENHKPPPPFPTEK